MAAKVDNSVSTIEMDSDSNDCYFYPTNQLEADETDTNGAWWMIPEPVLLRILSWLPITDMVRAGGTCRRWNTIANDDLIWKHKFQQHYKIDPCIPRKPVAVTWKSEYIRLTCTVPLQQSQILSGHANQVLHVNFSHNGEMFSTCSKDGYVIVWNSSHPCREKYSHNMKQFSWKYTQYSQFNESDTLLLVSGVHFGAPHNTSGEIAVFTVDGNKSYLRCRVVSRPYDVFGTWFSDQYLISGDLHWLAHLVSTSVLWLNKANQEIDSEHVPIMNQLYKFYNKNASSVRALLMAKCPWLDETNGKNRGASSTVPDRGKEESYKSSDANATEQNELSDEFLESIIRHFIPDCAGPIRTPSESEINVRNLDEYRKQIRKQYYDPIKHSDYYENGVDDDDEDDEMQNSVPKYLIFSTGSKTFTPHQIGIKRVSNVSFPKRLDPGPSLRERIAAKKMAENNLRYNEEIQWWNYESVADRFDKVDKIIDLHGHIIGMALSPDHRYLYVNTRPWPKDYELQSPLDPPPIAQEIDIHIIDMMSLECVGTMLRTHKAYTSGSECFFIFLDVSNDYVASGAEDNHGYLWDRYYGICLAKYQHHDVVNSVAFNPKDSGMLVTTSDDYKIKIWRSREKIKEFKIDTCNQPMACEANTKFL